MGTYCRKLRKMWEIFQKITYDSTIHTFGYLGPDYLFFINICASTLPFILTYIVYAITHNVHLTESSTVYLKHVS